MSGLFHLSVSSEIMYVVICIRITFFFFLRLGSGLGVGEDGVQTVKILPPPRLSSTPEASLITPRRKDPFLSELSRKRLGSPTLKTWIILNIVAMRLKFTFLQVASMCVFLHILAGGL